MRKKLINTAALLSLLFLSAFPKTGFSETLEGGIDADKYEARSKAVLNFGLVYYGNYWKEKDLKRIALEFERKFKISTNGILLATVDHVQVIPFTDISKKMKKFTLKYVSDPVRLRRLWYYENNKGSSDIAEKIYKLAQKTNIGKSFKNLDALLVVTGAQFEGLGVAVGRMLMTQYPREVAWAVPGNRVDYPTDAEVIDELLHEAGHFMGFGHAAYKCSMRYQKSLADVRHCCETSPNREDVMSYCRNRSIVTDQDFFKYETCHLKIIQDEVLLKLSSGAKIRSQNASLCE